jgi:hypothetical protein
MADTTHRDDHVAGLYRAMALRFYSRYVDMRHSAEHRGGDLADYGRLPTQNEADERYKAAVEEWLWENPASAAAATALVEFAGVLAVDRLTGEVTREPVNDERDAYHQALALASVARWLDDHVARECVTRERAARDAELFALIAEYQRRHEHANEKGLSDEERARRCDDFRAIRHKIEQIRPRTLRGILAVLELDADEDPDWWPEEAISGLRDIAEMEARS